MTATFFITRLSGLKISGMKHLAISLFLAGLLFMGIGCRKDIKSISGSLQGIWELRRVSGMITTSYPSGNGNTIEFAGDHYVMSSNGQITKSGQYEVIRDLSAESETCLVITQGQYINRIIYDNNTADRKVFLEISGDKLTFLSGCFAIDAGSSTEYARQ